MGSSISLRENGELLNCQPGVGSTRQLAGVPLTLSLLASDLPLLISTSIRVGAMKCSDMCLFAHVVVLMPGQTFYPVL